MNTVLRRSDFQRLQRLLGVDSQARIGTGGGERFDQAGEFGALVGGKLPGEAIDRGEAIEDGEILFELRCGPRLQDIPQHTVSAEILLPGEADRGIDPRARVGIVEHDDEPLARGLCVGEAEGERAQLSDERIIVGADLDEVAEQVVIMHRLAVLGKSSEQHGERRQGILAHIAVVTSLNGFTKGR